ncbi:hypothetical protein F5Y10DRAFT_160974 [Nemania abortiva]|nr:hypothetical protein F5Y10DRAFT_160974 [Nemania abortiva]
MNWTEGSLVRHSRRRERNALVARQKQHFAKARLNLLSGQTKQGPAAISFLTSKLTSESPRRATRPRDHQDAPATPILTLKQEPRREHPPYLPDTKHGAVSTNLDRRKRLLEKSDWAGLRLQKPLDISFPGQIYATKRWTRVARPPERTPNSPEQDAIYHREVRSKRLRRSSMRIQIGSQEIQPSIATGSYSSIKRCAQDSEGSTQISQYNSIVEDGWRIHPGRARHRCTNASSGEVLQTSPSLREPETPFNVVYSSSVILEPAPRRNGVFSVLQWSPAISEDRGSMQVEVEHPVRPVSSSQESEQQRWKDWVLSEEPSSLPINGRLTVTDTTELHSENSESSVLTLPSHLQHRLPSLHLSSEADLASGRCPSERTSIEITTTGSDVPQDNRCSPEKDNLPPSSRQCISRKEKDGLEDLNDIWMKFACGDDENSEELLADAFKEAAHRVAVELRPSDTSGSLDDHTETIVTCTSELPCIGDQSDCNAVFPGPSSASHMATIGASGSETASSNIATVGSSGQTPYSSTRFIIPKPFIGKHVNADPASIDRGPTRRILRERNKRKGRSKKRAMDGRTDIRNLPDFDGDPIEEIEDD